MHRNPTLQLVWEAYREDHPEGYRYSHFCELYRNWARQLDAVLRQEDRGAEKLFIDYARQNSDVRCPDRRNRLYRVAVRAVLGASSDTFVEATRSQDLTCWIGSHIRALEFLGPGCLTCARLPNRVPVRRPLCVVLLQSRREVQVKQGSRWSGSRCRRPWLPQRDSASPLKVATGALRSSCVQASVYGSIAKHSTPIRAEYHWITPSKLPSVAWIKVAARGRGVSSAVVECTSTAIGHEPIQAEWELRASRQKQASPSR